MARHQQQRLRALGAAERAELERPSRRGSEPADRAVRQRRSGPVTVINPQTEQAYPEAIAQPAVSWRPET
jgi:hypothetical protein